MVYKIGTGSDLGMIPLIDDTALELLHRYGRVLTYEYGEDRNIDTGDGGFVLYCPKGTKTEDIKAYFDYTNHIVESVDRYGELYAAMYILHNEFAVMIVGWMKDAPTKFIKEIN